MRKRTSMSWLLPALAIIGVGAAAPASLAAPEPPATAAVASGAAAVVSIPVAPSNDAVPEAACGFTHRGDQSRSLELAVTGLHRKDGGARATLAWTAPRFTSHLDGYEYRAHVGREGPRGALWVDTGALTPTLVLPAALSGRDHAFEVVARYRYPLGDGHVYYWYGPAAMTGNPGWASAGCGSVFGHPDTTLAYE